MTRLKALELFGFKSFADRTRFEFPAGITAVVGPNGSGKSNVVDAIKWVLGEQSVRSLRGKEMADVIFAGCATRKPLNYAEVSLVFDNSARLLSLPTAEVVVMRRVQRSGESEYLLNGELARLRDIRELFAGTGAATQAYSVIEQGRVDALLVASGRERRAVFEEAAGIARFRVRRTEALRRLERAEANGQRLADLAGELETRLEGVRQQAARARRWQQLTDRLRSLRLAAAHRDLAEVDAAVADIESVATRVGEQLSAVDSRTRAAAIETVELAGAAEDLQAAVSACRAAVAAATRQAAAAEALLALARGRHRDLERAVETARRDEHRERIAWQAATAAAATAEAALESLTERCRLLDDRLAALESTANGSHDEAGVRSERVAAAAALLERARERGVRLEAVVQRAGERAHEAALALETAHRGRGAAGERLARLVEAEAACEGGAAALETTLRHATAELAEREGAERAALSSLRTAWGGLADRRAALEACRERAGVLRELVERRDGLSEAARELLAGGPETVPGLVGPVADLLEAHEDWARLVDMAIGTAAEGLFVESLEEAVRWHDARRRQPPTDPEIPPPDPADGGVRLIAPLASHRDAGSGCDLTGRAGVVGRLDRLLAGPPRPGADLASSPNDSPNDSPTGSPNDSPNDSPTGSPTDQSAGSPAEQPCGSPAERVRAALLARTWIVERPVDALPLVGEAPPGTRFVARTGERIDADGRFEFGRPAGAAGLVSRRAELTALERRAADLRREVESAERGIDSLQATVEEERSLAAEARSRRGRAAEMLAAARQDLARTSRERTAAAADLVTAERLLLEAEQRSVAEASHLRVAQQEAADSSESIVAAAAAMSAAEAALRTLSITRDAIADELQCARIERATSGEKLARGREARDTLAAAAADRAAALSLSRGAIAAANRGLADHELGLLAATADHAQAIHDLEREAAALAAAERRGLALDERRQRLAAAIEEDRGAAARLADEAHRRALEAGEARHRRSRIVERIRDDYGIEIDRAEPAETGSSAEPAAPATEIPADRAALEREIDELRRRLGSHPAVNLDALREAEELSARLATLHGQLADMAEAKRSIETLVERIDEESRRLLGETIRTVRGHFQELFARLFGGGQADLVLEDGVDLLEAAVEIVARPPGKEPRSISLLSGGEKTMTCVALLLAIFRSSPSPFCILDEVDAALDEANVDRFSGVLRDFLAATQFIVVTHSKKTMSAAQTLYGVTMEESGVSRRISVRFEAAAAARAA